MSNPRPGSMRERARERATPAPDDHAHAREHDWQDRRAQSQWPRQPQRRQPRDPAKAPADFDQDYWGMAVLFRDRAARDDISLRAGVPVIYGELRRVFEWFDLEHGTRPFQSRGDGTVELTYSQMYRDGKGKQLTWVEVGYAIIEEFWNRVWDADALSHFCDMDAFVFITRYVCEGWSGQRMRAHFKAHPPPVPDIETWNRDGHRRRRTRAI